MKWTVLILNKIIGVFYKFRLWFINLFGGFKRCYGYVPTDDLKLVFEDRFNGQKLNMWKWRVGQSWGKIHPKEPWNYTDKSCIKVTKGNLELSTKYAPDEIPYKGDVIKSTYARGEVEALRKFGRGVYEFRCKIIKDGWFAIWIWGKDSEVDIVEASPSKATFSNHVHRRGQPSLSNQYHNITLGWHTFNLIWNDDIEIKMDGVTIAKHYNVQDMDDEMFLEITNKLYEGETPKEPFLTDYIRVWQPK